MELPEDSDPAVVAVCREIASWDDYRNTALIYHIVKHYAFSEPNEQDFKNMVKHNTQVRFVADIKRATLEDLEARDIDEAQRLFSFLVLPCCFIRQRRFALIQLLGFHHEFDTTTFIPRTVFKTKTAEILALTESIVLFLENTHDDRARRDALRDRVRETDPCKEAESRTAIILDTIGCMLQPSKKQFGKGRKQQVYHLCVDPIVIELFERSTYWKTPRVFLPFPVTANDESE